MADETFPRMHAHAAGQDTPFGLKCHPRMSQEVADKNERDCHEETLASFPGLPRLQFLIACSIKNWRQGRLGNEARETLNTGSYTPCI